MDKQLIQKALDELKKQEKRKFVQSYDIVITLKALDLKKTENQVDFFATLNHPRTKTARICALVGPELKADAEKICETVIEEKDFNQYAKDKKKTKKLAEAHTFFIAQANIMPKVASAFGKVLGPKKKMPNPKAGCIVPPKINLKPLYDKLQKLVAVVAKERPVIQITIGTETTPDDQIIDNILVLYAQLLSHLPAEKNNIRRILLKLTMGKPVKLV